MDLNELRTAVEYQAARESVFRSEQALRWYMRRHRAKLVAAGAIVIVNRSPLVVPARFDAAVLDIGADLARGAVAA